MLLDLSAVSGIWLSLHKADLFGGSQFIGAGELRAPVSRRCVSAPPSENTLLFRAAHGAGADAHRTWAGAGAEQPPRAGPRVLRGLFFSSSVLSVTIVTLIWRMVLIPDGGLIANLLTSIGLPPGCVPQRRAPGDAGHRDHHHLVVHRLPMMLFLAALQQVPQDLYEAASARQRRTVAHAVRASPCPRSGAPRWSSSSSRSFLQFQLFGQAQIMTLGGPNNASLPIVLFIYQVGFQRWDIGYAAAASEILFGIILIAAMTQYFAARGRESR
jgi:multiple sugar transport system permease protein